MHILSWAQKLGCALSTLYILPHAKMSTSVTPKGYQWLSEAHINGYILYCACVILVEYITTLICEIDYGVVRRWINRPSICPHWS